MLHLYLLRHGEAAPKEARQDDQSRELTQNGVRDCVQLGAWFAAEGIRFDLIVSSSAMRAEQSAMLVAESMKGDAPRILLEDRLYEASVRQLLEYVNALEDGYHSVLIAGHNPAVSYFAEYLTKSDIGDMPPGSVVAISFDFNSWNHVTEGTGTLEGYRVP